MDRDLGLLRRDRDAADTAVLGRFGTDQPALLKRSKIARERRPLDPSKVGKPGERDWAGLDQHGQQAELCCPQAGASERALIMLSYRAACPAQRRACACTARMQEMCYRVHKRAYALSLPAIK